jgi:hypothetical protein
MSFVQLLSVASLMAAAFLFSCYIVVNSLLLQWKDEF